MKQIILLTLLALLTAGCSFRNYSNYSVNDGVMLAVTGQEADRISLKIRNDRTAPIFFGYQRGKDTKHSIVDYGFLCYQDYKAVEETDFGPKNHSGMGLDPIEPGDELEFEVSPLPDIKRNCSISVGYYDNKKAVEIVEKLGSGPRIELLEEELKFLEQLKQKVIVTQNINGNNIVDSAK